MGIFKSFFRMPCCASVPIQMPKNQFRFTEQFDNPEWFAVGMTITPDDTASPTGTVTADKILETDTVNSLMRNNYYRIITPQALYYTVSIFIKPSNIQWYRMVMINSAVSAGYIAWFDLTNIAKGTAAPFGVGWTLIGTTIADAGNGWRRISMSVIPGDPTLYAFFNSATADVSATRVASGTYWLWGAQGERSQGTTGYEMRQ